MLTAALAIGIAVSLVLFHVTGLSAGGIITPGYVALILDRPVDLALFLAVAFVTFGLIRLVSDWLMLYGARRFGLTVLIGLALAIGAKFTTSHWPVVAADWAGFGYIVPGLLAHQLDRQGIVSTLLMLAIAAPLVRLALLLATRW